MASIGSIEKDSIATTRDSFKDCILACKISNQMHKSFEKRKVPQAASANFIQKWLFCKTYVLAVLVVLPFGHLRRYLPSTNLVIVQTNATPKRPLFTAVKDNQI